MTNDYCDYNWLMKNVSYYAYLKPGVKLCNVSSTSYIKKCCAPGYYLDDFLCQKNNSVPKLSISVYRNSTESYVEEDFHKLSIGYPNCETSTLYFGYESTDAFFLQTNGSLYIPEWGSKAFVDHFCIENNTFAAVCHDEVIKIPLLFTIFAWGK